MSRIIDMLKDTLKQPLPGAPEHLYAWKTRFALLGSVGSGKSVIATLIALTSQTLSSDQPRFKCDIIESTSGILGDVSRMREGRFPAKTVAYQSYATEPGLLIIWESLFGDKKVQIPIADLAGEDFQVMIQRYSENPGGVGKANYSAAMRLINYVKQADGFILVAPASKARTGYQVEEESGADKGVVHFDPDVNLARILGEVYHYKQRVHKPIKGIAVVITKWDLVRQDVENLGIDIYDPTGAGLTEFMDVYFPSTMQRLRFYGMENVRFFTSYVELQRDDEGKPKTWDDASPKIEVKERRQPTYDVQSCVDLIDWLKTFAT